MGLGRLPPTIGYAAICLALIGRIAFDQIQCERSRRRKVASLQPRSRADTIPTLWSIVAAASSLMLMPSIAAGLQPAAAAVVLSCSLVMAAMAWRLAGAPLQLTGDDVDVERAHARAMRAEKAGGASILAVGIVFVFISFTGYSSPTEYHRVPVNHVLILVSTFVWVALLLWKIWYVRRVRGAAPAECSA